MNSERRSYLIFNETMSGSVEIGVSAEIEFSVQMGSGPQPLRRVEVRENLKEEVDGRTM